MSASVVDARDLHVSVAGTTLVGGVSLSLPAGEVTALVGESGSGKTTTALALLGEYPPEAELAGEVRVAGEVVDRQHPPPSGVVGYVPQHPSTALNPVRRVGSVLRELARRHVRARTRGERRRLVHERVREALRRAQLSERFDLLGRYPHQLSGGQQQRVLLAQVLVCRPRVVVADEPTTGQDAATRQRIVEELRELSAQGMAVLLLTHDLDVVRALAHRVSVMRHGEVLESGRAAAVLDEPEHEYTRRMVAARYEIPSREADVRTAAVLSAHALRAGHRGRDGWVDTVHDVSLDVRVGERVAVVGVSGSGKTTLCRCLAGLHPPSGGRVLLDGAAVAPTVRRRSREQIARVQYVFQDARASFDEFAPVVDQVARTARRLLDASRNEARAGAVDVLERVGLNRDVVTRLPGSLSGGELQRCALARALLSEPAVLICDEITSGLDTVTRAGVLELLDEVQRTTGCALVVVTHDRDVAAGFADRVVTLEAGNVVDADSPELVHHAVES